MRRNFTKLFSFAVALAIGVGLMLSAAATAIESDTDTGEFDGYLVRLYEAPRVRAFSAPTPEVNMQPVEGMDGLYFVDDIEQTNAYVHAGMVMHVVPNYRLYLLEDAVPPAPVPPPDDPYYTSQWNLSAIGLDLLPARAPGLTGKGVRVGIVDSGIAPEHPDLIRADGSSCVIGGQNFNGANGVTADPENWYDEYYHGTMVAGIIGATANNGIGIAGVAPEVELVSLKVLRVERDGDKVTTKGGTVNLLPAIKAAVDDFNCDVINMSVGIKYTGDTPNPELTAVLEYVASKGALLVASAGNGGGVTEIGSTGIPEGNRPYFPAGCPEVISVASTGRSGNVGAGSQRVRTTWISAPGEGVISTHYNPVSEVYSYQSSSGTSFSAPLVAAAGALLKQINPELTQAEFKQIVAENAAPFGEGGEYNQYGGHGILTLSAMLPAGPWLGMSSPDTDGALRTWRNLPPGEIRIVAAGYDEANHMIDARVQTVTIAQGDTLTLWLALTGTVTRVFLLDKDNILIDHT